MFYYKCGHSFLRNVFTMVGVVSATDPPSMFFILRSCLRGHLSYLSRDWWVGTGIMNEECALAAPNSFSLHTLGQCPNTVNGIHPNSRRNAALSNPSQHSPVWPWILLSQIYIKKKKRVSKHDKNLHHPLKDAYLFFGKLKKIQFVIFFNDKVIQASFHWESPEMKISLTAVRWKTVPNKMSLKSFLVELPLKINFYLVLFLILIKHFQNQSCQEPLEIM